jgi:ssDNA-binding Zn-finger/Zn-ribbon topoisomerase 1
MNKAEQLLEDLKLFLSEEVIEEEAEEKCPKCGSDKVKETMDGMTCDACGESWEKEKEDDKEEKED